MRYSAPGSRIGRFHVVTQRLVAGVQFVLESRRRCHGVRFEDDDRVVGQVVEQRRRLLEEERQVVFDAGMGHPPAHVLVHRAMAHVDVEGAVPAVAKTGDGRGIERHLLAGQHAHGLDSLGRPLRIRIEGA